MSEVIRKKIAYCPDYAILFDSVEVGVFLSQMHYWQEKLNSSDGYIYKSQEQIYTDTGLKPARQKVVRKILEQNSVLHEKRKVVYQRKNSKNLIHYKIDWQKIEYLFAHPEEVTTRYETQIRNVKKNDTEKQTAKLQVCNKEPKNQSFEEFWEKYDKKVGRQAAENLWQTLSEHEQTQAIRHAEQLAKHIEKRYRPDPQRYLAEKKYLDEIIPKKTDKNLTANQDEYTSSPMVGIRFKNRP
ncbi:hypothetical protein [Raineya sp.]